MSFWQTVYKAIFGSPVKDPAGGAHIGYMRQRYNLGVSSDFEAWVYEAFKQNETVNGALNLIANSLCEADLKVYDKATDEPLPDSDTQRLLDHINPIDTQKRFLKELVFNMYLGDMGYIEKVYDRRGRLTELRQLRPDRVSIDADPVQFISRYIYRVDGKEFILDPKDIIRLGFIDPQNRFGGFSPLKALAKRIDADAEATKHMKYLLENRGQPGTLITLPEHASREEKESIARAWSARFSGKNIGSTGVLDAGATASTLGYDLNQLDFTNQVNLFETKILATLRVPPPVYQSLSGQENSTYNNMRDAHKQFWTQCIQPLMSMIEDALNSDTDITMQGRVRVAFDISKVEALQEEQDAKSNRARADYQAGLITLNEARLCGGYDEIPDGDELRPAGLDLFKPPESTQDDDIPEKASEKSEKGEGSADYQEFQAEDLLDLIDSRIQLDRLDRGEETTKSFEKAVQEIEEERGIQTKNIDDLFLRQLEVALGRANMSDKYFARLARIVSKELQKQIKEAQDLLGTKHKTLFKSLDERTLRNRLQEAALEWQLALEASTSGVLGDAYRDGAIDAAKSVGHTIFVESEEVRQAIKHQTFKFAEKVSDTSVKQIQKVFAQAEAEGLSIVDTKNRLRKLSEQWDDVRATMIARTETSRFVHQGAVEGYKDSGVVEAMQWSAILDSSTSDICSALHGTIVSLSSNFINDGDPVPGGASLDYTGGVIQTPPAHINCRSTLLPIVSEVRAEGHRHSFTKKEIDLLEEYKNEYRTKDNPRSGESCCQGCGDGDTDH